jgi:starvation-inducible DNA-binding protein
MFQTLHLMFEQQYNELALAVDTIAERIRSLGYPAPASYSAYARLSTVTDTDGVPAATDMVRLLVADHETVVRTARKVLSQAEEAHDQATADVATERLQVHEKTAWMLRSLLED